MQKKSKCQLIKQKNRHIVEFKIIHSIMDKDLLIIILSKKGNIPWSWHHLFTGKWFQRRKLLSNNWRLSQTIEMLPYLVSLRAFILNNLLSDWFLFMISENFRCQAIKMHARWKNWSKWNALARLQWHEESKDQESDKELYFAHLNAYPFQNCFLKVFSLLLFLLSLAIF